MKVGRWVGWGVMTFLALGIALVAARYLSMNPAVYFSQQQAVYMAHQAAITLHVVGGVVALAVGPFQFLSRLRARRPRLHRWMGRVYLMGIAVGGVAGLYVASMAYGGWVGRSGFGMLALLWLLTAAQAYATIRAGQTQAHRRWMMRNYALTFAAVTLRLQLPLAGVLGLDFEVVYPVIAWTAWLPNLLLIEWWLRRGRRPRLTPVAAAK